MRDGFDYDLVVGLGAAPSWGFCGLPQITPLVGLHTSTTTGSKPIAYILINMYVYHIIIHA